MAGNTISYDDFFIIAEAGPQIDQQPETIARLRAEAIGQIALF